MMNKQVRDDKPVTPPEGSAYCPYKHYLLKLYTGEFTVWGDTPRSPRLIGHVVSETN